jgi:hypothetical protein
MGDSAIVAFCGQSRDYPYPDTVRYSYAEAGTSIHVSPGSIDFYEGDTANVLFRVITFEDSLYFNVGNHLPDSIYFRIFRYSDFKLDDSIHVPTDELTFIYRGKGLMIPYSLDSNNFHLVTPFREPAPYTFIEIYYDIVGLDTGIYEILPTLTIFGADSQEYGYRAKWMYGDRIGVHRNTCPLYIREKRGWIDSVNVYLSEAVRYELAGQMNTALSKVELALRLYPGASEAFRIKSWIYDWSFLFDLGRQWEDYFYNMRKWHKDWYINRFYQINKGIARDEEALPR